MGKLGSIAAAARQKASDKAFEVGVLREAGILGLHRPDKSAKVVSAFLRWGASPALGITTAAIHFPHETGLIDERGSLTFEQLHRRSNALAHAFERIGIGYGDGVGIMCRNHRGFVEATLAAAKLGAGALYLNTIFAGPQLRRGDPPRGAEGARLRRGVRRPARRASTSASQRVLAWSDGATTDEPTLDALIAARRRVQTCSRPPDKPPLRDPHLRHDRRRRRARSARAPTALGRAGRADRQDPLPQRASR